MDTVNEHVFILKITMQAVQGGFSFPCKTAEEPNSYHYKALADCFLFITRHWYNKLII